MNRGLRHRITSPLRLGAGVGGSDVLVYRFAKAFGWDFVENEVIWDGVMMYISTALERVLGHA